jgi:hypothetical protein
MMAQANGALRLEAQKIVPIRMRNQRLWGHPLDTPEAAVRWLVAMQSQEFRPAKWAVGQRTAGATNAALDRAYAEGAVLRTHILRPTWHFVAANDLRWLMALSGPRVHALNAFMDQRLELDASVVARTNALLGKALAGGRHLTRTELGACLNDASIPASGQRLAYIVMRAELDSVICSGAPRGKQHTYALFDERVPPGSTFDRDQALAQLTEQYFTSRGPATLKDFLRWSSLTAKDGRRGLELAGSKLEHEVVDARTYWFAASPTVSGRKPASPRIDLVQIYDEYVMGYSESRDLIQLPGTSTNLFQGRVIFPHAILLDGLLVGRWRTVMSARSGVVETQLSRPLDPAEEQALGDAVQRYGAFVEMPVTLAS